MSSGPIITLLTDFGTRDSYVAEVKGVLLTRAPDAVLVDVTHEIPPGDVLAAQYVLERTWPRFPAGTVHLAVVDPGVGSERRALAAAGRGHGFIAPDNGLLTPMLAGATVVAPPEPADASLNGNVYVWALLDQESADDTSEGRILFHVPVPPGQEHIRVESRNGDSQRTQ